jgi:hypothetical protein
MPHVERYGERGIIEYRICFKWKTALRSSQVCYEEYKYKRGALDSGRSSSRFYLGYKELETT